MERAITHKAVTRSGVINNLTLYAESKRDQDYTLHVQVVKESAAEEKT